MKNLKFIFISLAIIIGIFVTLSFVPKIGKQNTGFFYVNPDGTMGDPVLDGDTCYGLGSICYQEYDLDTELPTGFMIRMGQRNQ